MINIKSNLGRILSRISPNPEMRFLNSRDAWLEKDIFNVASIVFNIETALKLGKKIDKVNIPISTETATDRDIIKVEKLLNDLFIYTLIEDVEIKFDVKNTKKDRRGKLPKMAECSNVCLFSGGADSLSGLLSTKKYLDKVHAVSVVHGDQTWGSHIVNNLMHDISKFEKIPHNILYAPPMGAHGYSQLRGFLYVLFGSIYVSLLNSKNLIVAECGPTMYQPRFSPYDTVTMTTHPFVMNSAKEIIEIFLKRKLNIILPHENMTKSEVIIASPYKEFFKKSHSCISLRFGKNEGTCYGCTIRRLGFLVADVEDVVYTYDPIGNKKYNADHLVSLLGFCYDLLFDYKNLPLYSKENILTYNKRDLFKRFALDNFAALHIYKKRYGKLNPYVETLYNSAINNLGEEKLDKRITKVRGETFKPNFLKMV